MLNGLGSDGVSGMTKEQYWAGVALAALIRTHDDLSKSAALGEFTLGESSLGDPGPVQSLVSRAWEYADVMSQHDKERPRTEAGSVDLLRILDDLGPGVRSRLIEVIRALDEFRDLGE